ncbi:hypothetical protein [Nonomuraea dietziae]
MARDQFRGSTSRPARLVSAGLPYMREKGRVTIVNVFRHRGEIALPLG